MEGENIIQDIVLGPALNSFIENSLTQSLSDIGYPAGLISDLFIAIKNGGCEQYSTQHAEELYQCQTVHFLGELAGKLFEKYVVPEVPQDGKILDLGCGTGTLLKELIKRGGGTLIGIDVNLYPAWNELNGLGIKTAVVAESEFETFMKKEVPDSVVMTWVLHHMNYVEQEEYLRVIFNTLKSGSRLVVLEDSYSEKLRPEQGKAIYSRFMALDKQGKMKVMSAFDWIANRVLAGRRNIPMPFGFRTLEEWAEVFKKAGFIILKERFIGFPKDRDVNNGQSLFVLAKP